jgi:hypothetical protein
MTLKENLERAKWPITFFLVAMLVMTLLRHFVGTPSIQKQYVFFYKKDIQNGVLTYIYGSNGGTRFKIDGEEDVFTFFPDFVNYNVSFENVAEIGDTVVKPSKSDTLILIHHRKQYRFTFEKLVANYLVPE